MKTPPITFWLTNISNRNVSLTDLNLTVKAWSAINLMDTRHYKYTIEQLRKSEESGSIFKKRDKLVVRKVAPDVESSHVSLDFLTKTITVCKDATIPSRERSILNIKEEYYEELNIDEKNDEKLDLEKFAKENADLIEMDAQPLLKKV
jgi:hypothetical protein